jgi:hypothetical protein
MEWKVGTPLTAQQTGHPVLRHATLTQLGYGALNVRLTPDWFVNVWGDTKTTKRLRTFGHEDPKDRTSPHFLATRSGTPFHTDPGYTRYALQLQLYNEGFVVHGLEDQIADMPLFVPGLVILLDTWSPHRVAPDPRLPQLGPNKLLIGMDYLEPPNNVAAELRRLVAHLQGGIHL